MPNERFHVKIDEEVLKPLRLIPRNFDTKIIHGAMDEGTGRHGWLHRVIDKWHEPRFQANVGFNTEKKLIPKDMLKEANWTYRVAKTHRLVDELYYRSKVRNGKYPSSEKIKKSVMKILSDKSLVRRHFNL